MIKNAGKDTVNNLSVASGPAHEIIDLIALHLNYQEK
jgi:hypothetical protein